MATDADFLPRTVSVGIVTRDRWENLRETLQSAQSFGLSTLPFTVLDDGSRTPCPPELARDFPWVHFVREETSHGYIVQRNRLARLLATPLWLELDDDSFPVAGSLESAARYMVEHPKVACLAFNLIEKLEQPVVDPEAAPWQAQRFVGCAGLLNRAVFLQLGGYREELYYLAEEGDYCARALAAGYATVYFPGLVIRHRRTQVNRSTRKQAFFQGRNRCLLVLWNFPMPQMLKKLFLSLPGTLSLVKLRDYPTAVAGFFAGLWFGFKERRFRQAMPVAAYRTWNSLAWKAAD